MLKDMNCFSKIGSGSTRSAYICVNNNNVPDIFSDWINKDIVIKEAKTERGVRANKVEYKIWSNNKFNFLCPILTILNDGEYIIMPKVNTTKITEYHVSKVVSEYRKYCYLSIHSDIKKKNIGLYKGKLVLIDYPFIEQDYAGFDAIHL